MILRIKLRTTARFEVQRIKDLENIFDEENVKKIWQHIVRKQLRSLDILDLHDYYDFNYQIESKIKQIKKNILSGVYKTKNPLIYKVEKKFGICRHLMLPNPTDALVFQVIVESIASGLKDIQPSKQAYYSRDKNEMKLPHEHQTSDYTWRAKWKSFQKQIFKFSKDYEYLAVTDLTNYYDNIGLRELRHIISGHIKAPEVILDLLFKMIEELSWNPDYLPTSLNGLPTINLEAPRLLAHVLLFELDEILKEKTNDSFVRWMDDINFGVDNKEKANEILGEINDVLKSRGLALNIAKTNIYTADEVEKHFFVQENEYLDNFDKKITENTLTKSDKTEFFKYFRKHLKNKNLQNWSKITKRFFTSAGKIKAKNFLDTAKDLFLQSPNLRQHITFYIQYLGFNTKTAKIIIEILENVKIYDDITKFYITKLLSNISIPRNKMGIAFINEISKFYNKPQNDFDYYCTLWFYAKYKEPYEILSLIENKRDIWINEPFLSRQVVSILPRIIVFKEEKVLEILEEQISNGTPDAASVAKNIKNLLNIKSIDKKLNPYLFYKNKPTTYPLPKFLILLTVLQSSELIKKEEIIKKAKENINDVWYLYWLTNATSQQVFGEK